MTTANVEPAPAPFQPPGSMEPVPIECGYPSRGMVKPAQRGELELASGIVIEEASTRAG